MSLQVLALVKMMRELQRILDKLDPPAEPRPRPKHVLRALFRRASQVEKQ